MCEVKRAKQFGQDFRLLVDEGDIMHTSEQTLEEIGEKLRVLRAAKANATNINDRQAILFRILDPHMSSLRFIRRRKLSSDALILV